MSLFVILNGDTPMDFIKSIKMSSDKWTDKSGVKHEVGAVALGNGKNMRTMKDGRIKVWQDDTKPTPKASKKTAKGVK